MRASFFAACGSVALTALGAIASCSSDRGIRETNQDDADAEATGSADDAQAFDAGVPDEPRTDSGARDSGARDSGSFDGGPLPVVCASAPCATSLVTTRGRSDDDNAEGFCALLDDGTVACWGANGAGQLGRGAGANSVTAAHVVGLSDIVQLDHTCALDSDGGIWCWGTGPFLGNDAGAVTTARTPLQLALPPATSVGLGVGVACASVDDGVTCWGENSSRIVSAESAAVLAPQVISVPPGASIRDVVVGNAAFVLREDRETVSWGAKTLIARVSSLAVDPYPRPIALAGVSSIDVTSDSACATAAGIGYCWGRAMRPATFTDLPFERGLPVPVVTPEPIVQIATTRSIEAWVSNKTIIQPQRWCAVAASGNVYCWGYNASGQAGDGTTDHALEAVQVDLPERAVEVRTMPDATCALLTSGEVYCWGSNDYGQLGSGTIGEPSSIPQRVVLP